MGFVVSFLKFAFDLLAWPLFGLGCPLQSRTIPIRRCEIWWHIGFFSLVSLFELAFVNVIDLLPFWPYLKLMAMCLLVLPDFNGASYVYDCLLCRCLSVDLRAAIKCFIKPKEDKNLDAKSFLAAVDRYVQENGSEALKELLDRKTNHTKPDVGAEEIKAMTNTEERDTAAAIQEARLATIQSNLNSPRWHVKCVEPNRAQNEKKTVAVGEFKEKTVAAAGGNYEAVEITNPKKVQREWTCALCQMTTTCEKNLDSHLQGRKHKDKCDELKASKQVNKNKGSSSSAFSPEPKKNLYVDRPSVFKTKKAEDKVHVNWTTEQYRVRKVDNTGGGRDQFKFQCTVCDVKLISAIDLISHLGGKRHLSNTQ